MTDSAVRQRLRQNDHGKVRRVLEECTQAGVSEYCVCAGARNAPLVFALESAPNLTSPQPNIKTSINPDIKVWYFFEERSAAFFALGRARETRKPVAVVTTSGTAAAETLPAAIEGYYQGLPLLLLTADRPSRFRRSGSPQTIEQVGLFGSYVEGTWDVEEDLVCGGDDGAAPGGGARETTDLDCGGARGTDLDIPAEWSDWSRQRPFHINVCLEEPNRDTEIADVNWELPVRAARVSRLTSPSLDVHGLVQPLVIVGPLTPAGRPAVLEFLLKTGVPAFVETLSGIRGHPALAGRQLRSLELRSGVFQSVLRIGAVPTHRAWRDLENVNLDVVHVTEEDSPGWPGLSTQHPNQQPRRQHVLRGLPLLTDLRLQFSQDWRDELLRKAGRDGGLIRALCQKFPESEQAMLQQLSARLSYQAPNFH
ncbi:MAG: hypothetical protein C5B49_05925, partial [Bdellovibrio sp.]